MAAAFGQVSSRVSVGQISSLQLILTKTTSMNRLSGGNGALILGILDYLQSALLVHIHSDKIQLEVRVSGKGLANGKETGVNRRELDKFMI